MLINQLACLHVRGNMILIHVKKYSVMFKMCQIHHPSTPESPA